jgi:hypothetical protein
MMNYIAIQIFDIDSMPRGRPDASWLDRWLQTDRPEYLDRDDVDDLTRTVSARSTTSDGSSATTTRSRASRSVRSPTCPIPKSSNSRPATEDCREHWLRVIPPSRSRSPMLPLTMLVPVVHDGFISLLRAYSPSALSALARYADPAITLELRRGPFSPLGRPKSWWPGGCIATSKPVASAVWAKTSSGPPTRA